jgi:hypothetical protein
VGYKELMPSKAMSTAMVACVVCVALLSAGCQSPNKRPTDMDRLAADQQRDHILRENNNVNDVPNVSGEEPPVWVAWIVSILVPWGQAGGWDEFKTFQSR